MVYGKRGKIGIICPAPGSSAEMEFHKMVSEGVALLTTRVPLGKANTEALARLKEYAEDAAILLTQAKPDLLIFWCTAGSFIKGIGYDKEIISNLEKHTKISTITTTTSVIEAMKILKISKLCMVTPYLVQVTEAERVFLEYSGFKITSQKCLNYENAFDIASVDSEQIYTLVKETITKDAEAIFISCTGLTVMHMIDDLEREFKIPVITSNQATIWGALRQIAIRDRIEGYGKLFNY